MTKMKLVNATDSRLSLKHPSGNVIAAEPQTYTLVDKNLLPWLSSFLKPLGLRLLNEEQDCDLPLSGSDSGDDTEAKNKEKLEAEKRADEEAKKEAERLAKEEADKKAEAERIAKQEAEKKAAEADEDEKPVVKKAPVRRRRPRKTQ